MRRRSKIFICYRRDDTGGQAGRLRDRLVRRYVRRSVFIDVHALDPGDPFPLRIQTELQSCDVVIALIGHIWGGQDFSNGRSRLEDPSDFVRAELTMAIDNGLSIIPVLVDGSEMSKSPPSSLTELLRRHAMPLHHQTFDANIESLYRVLDKYSSHAQGFTKK